MRVADPFDTVPTVGDIIARGDDGTVLTDAQDQYQGQCFCCTLGSTCKTYLVVVAWQTKANICPEKGGGGHRVGQWIQTDKLQPSQLDGANANGVHLTMHIVDPNNRAANC